MGSQNEMLDFGKPACRTAMDRQVTLRALSMFNAASQVNMVQSMVSMLQIHLRTVYLADGNTTLASEAFI